MFGILTALLLAGCAGYQLGPTNHRQAGAQSIQVNPFQNKTIEPRLSDSVGNALRKALQQDGTFTLDTHDDGDIIVSGVIMELQRSYLSFNPKDIITPQDYQLVLSAQIKAVERATGKVLVDKKVVGRTTVRVGSDVPSAELRALPLLAETLARNATSLLVDGEW